jgi:hypothetical protein
MLGPNVSDCTSYIIYLSESPDAAVAAALSVAFTALVIHTVPLGNARAADLRSTGARQGSFCMSLDQTSR